MIAFICTHTKKKKKNHKEQKKEKKEQDLFKTYFDVAFLASFSIIQVYKKRFTYP